MIITTIKQMTWANPEQTYVTLIADTADEGNDLQISTPYSEESIIYEAIREYNVELIEPYVAPTEVPEIAAELSNEQVLAIVDALESRVPGIKAYISNNIT
jgi:hypothetical protein